MPSPFPGMDPYLEPYWLDIHTSLISGTRNTLNDALPNDLIASAEERIAIEDYASERRPVIADVGISERADAPPVRALRASESGVATLPYRLIARGDPITERYVEIISAGNEQLITVIEFVSPTNKRGPGLHAFKTKRDDLLAAGVNFVEIDLVRAGDWRALLAPYFSTKLDTPYRVTIRTPAEPGVVQFQPITLREKLPKIPIPLRASDASVWLDLQPLLDSAYDDGRYSRRLDYKKPLDPPLDAEDAQWAETLLHAG